MELKLMLANHEDLFNHIRTFIKYENTEVGEELDSLLVGVKTLEHVPTLENFDDEAINNIIDQVLKYCKDWILYCLFECGEDISESGLPEEEQKYWTALYGELD